MSKWLAGGLAVVVVVIIGLVVMKPGQQRDKPREGNQTASQSPKKTVAENNDLFMQQYGRNCDKSAQPVFSKPPLALDKLGYVVPLGNTSDGHVTPTDHAYIYPIDQTVADNTYDLVMPADGRVVQVERMPAQYIGDRSGVKLAPDDFRLVIAFSCRYFGIFIHVHKLGDTLASAVGSIEPGKNKELNVNLKAGDLLAHLGPNGCDWSMHDTTVKLPGFITPSMYDREPWKIHTIDQFSLFTGDLKTALEAKSLRPTAPFGGKIDWDKAGALAGNWFKTGTNGYEGATPERYWDGHLSIAPDNIDPTAIVYSTGNWEGKADQFAIKGDFQPDTITAATGLTKVELIKREYLLPNNKRFDGRNSQRGMTVDKVSHGKVVGTVILQVMPGEKLKVEQVPGKTADQVTAFTSAAVTYER